MKSAEPPRPVANERHAPGGPGVGTDSTPARAPDPYALLADLMAVVEELCPRWPERDTFAGSRVFRL